jgi:hypothetical protein
MTNGLSSKTAVNYNKGSNEKVKKGTTVQILASTPTQKDPPNQGCHIILGYNIPKRENIVSNHKIYQMAVKYRYQLSIKYTNMLHYKTLQNLSKSGFLV